MRIAIVGASGVYGRHLLPRLAGRGHSLRALVRNPGNAASAVAAGAELITADIFDEDSLKRGIDGCELVINLATSLPSPTSKSGDFAANDLLRREGTKLLMRACRAANVQRLIQQSIAMTHAGGGDAWADETTFHAIPTDTVAGAAIAAVRDMEETVVNSGLDWAILRGALFYGPGTGFDDEWFARAQAGKLRLPGDGSDFVSLVHIADMAAATEAAVARWPSRQALIIADDEPARWSDVFGHVCALAKVAPPEQGGPTRMPSFRVRNARAKSLLAFSPRYASYREGLVR